MIFPTRSIGRIELIETLIAVSNDVLMAGSLALRISPR